MDPEKIQNIPSKRLESLAAYGQDLVLDRTYIVMDIRASTCDSDNFQKVWRKLSLR